MKKRILIVLGILIVAGGAGAGGWYYLQNRSEAVQSDEVAYVSTVSSITGIATGVTNRYAGVVEPQETVEVKIESGRRVSEVQVKVGDEVKQGQLLFQYDLSSIQEELQKAQLDLDRLKNEAMSLNDQIKTLEAEKKKASKDKQLAYTIEIESNRMNLKKNEYDQKSKEAEIERLQSATGNTEVRSEIDGIIQKIDTAKMETEDGDFLEEDSMMGYYGDSSENDAFITILSTGAYRVKGKINELNAADIVPGEPMIIRSRVDEDVIWRGTMGNIDRDNAVKDEGDFAYGMMESGDEQVNSSSYPFYVELESSEGLMLGQHVFIEKDKGQEEKKDGIWLSDYYIVDADTPDPYVWAANPDGKLEKRSVILGNHNDELAEYEIVEGVALEDKLAYPAENLTEGMKTAEGNALQNYNSMEGAGMEEDYDSEGYDMEDYDMEGYDMEGFDDPYMDDSYSYDDPYMTEDLGVYEEDMGEVIDMEDLGEEVVSEVEIISDGEVME